MQTIGTNELCRLLAGEGNPPLTRERIRQLVSEGMPKVGRDEFDGVRCMFWFLGKMRRAVAHRETENEDGSSSGIRAERKRLIKTQADREELELAQLRREMVTVEDWEKATADLVTTAKARILAVPARVAPRVVGETNRVLVQGIIEKELKAALSAIAEAGDGVPSKRTRKS